MSNTIRLGIIGGGWPGAAHARGALGSGGFKLSAVADLIPQRRQKLMAEFQIPREYSDAADLIADRELDAVSICLPTHLHLPVTLAAFKAGKHVLCEAPPALSAAEAARMHRAAEKAGKVLLYALQRRFGGHEQAARQALARGLAGQPYHVRCVWTRTRGTPVGTGWYTQRAQSGGGALIDLGLPLLDIGWHLLGEGEPTSVFGATHAGLPGELPAGLNSDVEDFALAIVRLKDNRTLELAASWSLNQPQHQNGTVCRVYGTAGAIEVYTPQGAVLYRDFKPDGSAKHNPLKPPKLAQHAALMRHFRECILGKAQPSAGGLQGVMLMRMMDAIYKSSATGKSANLG